MSYLSMAFDDIRSRLQWVRTKKKQGVSQVSQFLPAEEAEWATSFCTRRVFSTSSSLRHPSIRSVILASCQVQKKLSLSERW